MGRKLDALLGRNRYIQPSRFKALVNVAVSRTAILNNHHKARSSYARSDVVQLLNLGHQERALLRVEIVIKENNMLDALAMIESYCYLLTERVLLLQKNKECPGEVKEAVSSLIFAASRCGEFPELQEIRRIFESKFGKDFANSAIELRNNCGVSLKMIQKFSTKQPNTESKMKVLNEIASENGITLHLEEETPIIIKEKFNPDTKHEQLDAKKSANLDNPEVIDTIRNLHEDIFRDDSFSESVKAKRFKDVASAAQEAFQSAAYAAAAARAAIELSRSESQDIDQDHQDGSNRQRNVPSDLNSPHAPETNLETSISSSESDHSDDEIGFEKNDPAKNFSSECEGEDIEEINEIIHFKQLDESPEKPATESISSVPNLDINNRNLEEEDKSINPNSIFKSEPVYEKLVGNGEDEFASKNEVADEDITVHKQN